MAFSVWTTIRGFCWHLGTIFPSQNKISRTVLQLRLSNQEILLCSKLTLKPTIIVFKVNLSVPRQHCHKFYSISFFVYFGFKKICTHCHKSQLLCILYNSPTSKEKSGIPPQKVQTVQMLLVCQNHFQVRNEGKRLRWELLLQGSMEKQENVGVGPSIACERRQPLGEDKRGCTCS